MRQEKILENQTPFRSAIVSNVCIIQIGVPVKRLSDILEYCCGVSQIGEWAGPLLDVPVISVIGERAVFLYGSEHI